jgi:hypothetical protein
VHETTGRNCLSFKPMLLTIFVALALAVGRLFVSPGKPTKVDFYKDAAHLFMGGLFSAAIIQGRGWQWWIFGLLSGWEVFVAVGSRTLWKKQ